MVWSRRQPLCGAYDCFVRLLCFDAAFSNTYRITSEEKRALERLESNIYNEVMRGQYCGRFVDPDRVDAAA